MLALLAMDALSRTTGSSDFKFFVDECLSDLSWNLLGAPPSGFGLVRLRRLGGFLDHGVSLEFSRRGNFGPSRRKLEELRSRIFALPPSSCPTRSVLFDHFSDEINAAIAD